MCMKARSSASVDDVMTVFYFPAFQLIGLLKRDKIDPWDDFRLI